MVSSVLQDLNVGLLRAFVSVVEAGSFTRAAAQLGRSQPAVSLQIQRLEEQLGVRLIDRSEKAVRVTLEGASLLTQARRLIRVNDEILAQLGEADVEGEIRFGAPEDIATLHLPLILATFARSHPRLRLAVTADYTANLLDQLSRGALDLALIKREPLGPEMGVRVWREPLIWVALDPALAEADPMPLVLAPAPDIYRKRALTVLQAHGVAFRAAFTSPSLAGQMAALRAGLGVGVLPAAVAPEDLTVLQEGLPGLPDSEIALVTARSARSGPAALLAREIRHALERGPSPGYRA